MTSVLGLLTSKRRGNLNLKLASFWNLDEASGNATDSIGGNTLTASGSPVSGAAFLGAASRQLTAASTQYLWCNSAASLLPTASGGFTVACWFNLDSLGALRTFVSKQDGATTAEYRMIIQANNTCLLQVSSDGSALTSAPATAAIAASGAWHSLVGWYDPVAGKVGLQLDNNAPGTSNFAGPMFAGTSKLFVGKNLVNTWLMNGRIDAVGYWNRALTAFERYQWWASGVGRQYATSGLYS